MSKNNANVHEGREAGHEDGRERLPAASGPSQSAEVVRQIIEQILANERRRARMEFMRLSIFVLLFICMLLGAGAWFAGQLMDQLRAERRLTEQTWRAMLARGSAEDTAAEPEMPAIPPALEKSKVERIEKNLKSISDAIESGRGGNLNEIRAALARQQEDMLALNARLNAAAPSEKPSSADRAGRSASSGAIAARIFEDINLRLPVPSL